MKPLSQRIQNIAGAGGRELVSRADLHYMGGGTIDFEPFEHIHAAGIRAIQEDRVGYTDNRGLAELRAAIADKLWRENNCRYRPEEVLVTPGSSEVLAAIPHAVLEPGDEAIMFDPHYIGAFSAVVELVSGTPVVLPTHGENNWQPDPEQVEKAITPRTKLLFMCSPSNPVGAALEPATVHALCEIARRHDLYVVSDELYERIMFDGKRVLSPASLPGMWERTFTCNGFSKAYGMTGWRVGYLAAPEPLVKAVHRAQVYVGICAPSMSQWAALAALTGPQGPHARMVAELQRRRDYTCERLNAIPGVVARPQDGTFYSFVDIRPFMAAKGEALRAELSRLPDYEAPESISRQFCDYVAARGGVYISPGGPFGSCGEGYFRISEADGQAHLERGLHQIEGALRAL